MFLFKKKKIVVDCFTPYKSVYELYKIRKAITYFPEHIKSMPRYISITHDVTKIKRDISTIKGCNGLTELYKVGFIIPFWTEFICQPKTSSERTSALAMMPNQYSFDTHPKEQYSGMYEEWTHAKLLSPWKFREKTGVKFSWNQAMWNHPQHANNFIVSPGVLWFDTQSTTNVNIFVNKKSEDFFIQPGTPLVHLIPISDAEVEIRNHFVEGKEWEDIDPIPSDWAHMKTNRWSSYLKEKKKSEEMDKQERKCPFGFGK